MTTEAQARLRLEAMLSTTEEPTLTAAEVNLLLDLAAAVDEYGNVPDQYRAWVPSAAYAAGDVVTPRTRNGHRYTVTVSDGLAGATEPTWPTTSGATVALDGVTYQESGPALWAQTWSLRAAAAEGWRWKAGKVASKYDFNSDVHGLKRDQLQKHCLEMVKLYERGQSGTILAGHAGLYDPVIGNLNGAP